MLQSQVGSLNLKRMKIFKCCNFELNYFLAKAEFFEVNGTSMYIDANPTGYSRDEAIALCNSLNMTLLSFENDTEKWENVNYFLDINGMYFIFSCRVFF